MLLTIAIPSYNRFEKLKSQLDQLLIVCNLSDFQFKIIVFDNHSTDKTSTLASHEVFNIEFNKFITNERNLGLVGNLRRCIEYVDTEFLWMLGDDDPIIIDELLKAIKELHANKFRSSINLIFFNPITLDNKLNSERGYIDDKIEQDKLFDSNIISEIRSIDPVLTFWISAFWIRGGVAKKIVENQKIHPENLMLPLYLVGKSIMSGKATYWNISIVKHRLEQDSWSGRYGKLVYWLDYPEVVLSLLNEGLPVNCFSDFMENNRYSFRKTASLLQKYPSSFKRVWNVHKKWIFS